MNNINENIDNLSKKNPFRVPENYFDKFSDKIFEKIELPEVAKEKTPFLLVFKSQFAMAAGIIGFALLAYGAYYFISDKTQVADKIAVVQDTTDAEYSFVEENHIIEALSTTTTKPKIEGDDIISYLVEDGVDENLIAEAY
jgi:hypothetical protein